MNQPLHKIQLLVPVNDLINLYVGCMFKCIDTRTKFCYIKYVHLCEINSKCFRKQLSENSFQLVFYRNQNGFVWILFNGRVSIQFILIYTSRKVAVIILIKCTLMAGIHV